MKPAWRDAAKQGDASALRAMPELGDGDVDSRDRYGQTALMIIARNGHIEAASVLINAHADLDCTAKYGLSALMLAIINGRDEIARLLIEAGADTAMTGTGAPAFAGKTAFDLASERGMDAIAGLLNSRLDKAAPVPG